VRMLDVGFQMPDKETAQTAVTHCGCKANIQVAFKDLPTNRVNNMVCAL